MDYQYSILGTDGKTYGPVSLELLKTWIAEGRINAETKVLRGDSQAWLTATEYPEIGLSLPIAVVQPIAPPSQSAAPAVPAPFKTTPTNLPDPGLIQQARAGASWFFWIAGLSLINTFLNGGFVVGLGARILINRACAGMGESADTISIVLQTLLCGLFICFGVFARKCQNWAFIVGMVLYALDGLIFLQYSAWIHIGFHAFALFRIFNGFQASQEYAKTQAAQMA